MGLKFIPVPRSTPSRQEIDTSTLGRLHRDIELKCFFAGRQSTFNYDMRMYVRSRWTPPPWLFPNEVKYRLQRFSETVKITFQPKPKSTENLLPHQHEVLRELQTSSDLLVVQCDKNLGPALIEHNEYVRLVNRDHLEDIYAYSRMSEDEANVFVDETRAMVDKWLTRHKAVTSVMERRFVQLSIINNKHPLPMFYATMKVHKTPLKTRPIVSCSGTLLENLGVWVDRKLQAFLPLFTSYFRSSADLKAEMEDLELPPGSQLFISDAVSMYTTIPTEHALGKITRFLRRHQKSRNEAHPYEAIIEGLGIVMRRCAFVFGDTFWKQESGTAMGTPPAPPYATIYFGLHEMRFLKNHHRNLLFYRRFIDDVIGVWRNEPNNIPETNQRHWDAFLDDLNSAKGLKWETSDKSRQVDYMDLTISISKGRIVTTLFEKPSNRHLYIPPHSCHPPGVTTGTIYGMVHRIMTLCSDRSDQLKRIRQFVLHMRARGHHEGAILPIVNNAISKMTARLEHQNQPSKQPDDDPKKRLFFHLTFHPDNPPSTAIQQAWKTKVSKPPFSRRLKDVRNHEGKRIGLERLTVAYHRSHNLGNLLSYRDLRKRNGPSVSSLID